MNSEERIIEMINGFVSKYGKLIKDNKTDLFNSKEIYFKAHAYHDILCVIDSSEPIEVLKEKLYQISEAILEENI